MLCSAQGFPLCLNEANIFKCSLPHVENAKDTLGLLPHGYEETLLKEVQNDRKLYVSTSCYGLDGYISRRGHRRGS
ncbi:hypothetical protein HDU92_008500 [Lobulomyces angularis]|nr:hypothetical protein HDU92_008500 [Lobulomyces angularis]